MSLRAPHRRFVVGRGRRRAASLARIARSRRARPARCVFLATGLVLGELLVLRLENGTALPLSYAVLLVLASSFPRREYAAAVAGAELISARAAHRRPIRHGWRVADHASSGSPSRPRRSRSYDARRASLTRPRRDRRRGAVRARRRRGRAGSRRPRGALGRCGSQPSFSARGRARVAGDRVVGHAHGDRLPRRRRRRARSASGDRCCSPRRCSRPGTRSNGSTPRRCAYRQTIEALAMAPELGGIVPPGHSQRVATLVVGDGGDARRLGARHVATSRWRRCCTTSVRSRSTSPKTRAAPIRRREVAAVTERDAARDQAARGRR